MNFGSHEIAARVAVLFAEARRAHAHEQVAAMIVGLEARADAQKRHGDAFDLKKDRKSVV